MEMMVVLLIVAIIAAASAPMVTKKLSRNTGTGDSPWVFTGLNNSIAYNMNGSDASAIIGNTTYTRGENGPQFPRLVLASGNDADHPALAFADANGNFSGQITMNRATNVVTLNDVRVGSNSTAIGLNQNATMPALIPEGATIVGASAQANTYSTSVGNFAAVRARGSVAIGRGVLVMGTNSVAIGATNDEQLEGDEFLTIAGNDWGLEGAISIGSSAKALQSNSIAIGRSASAAAIDSVILGSNSRVGDQSEGAVAIGSNIFGVGRAGVVIGQNAQASNLNGIAIGNHALANSVGGRGIAIGNYATATGFKSIAIGSDQVDNRTGNYTRATAENAVAIGADAQATERNSVAIGASSRASKPGQIVLGTPGDVVYIPGRLVVDGTVALARNSDSYTYMRANRSDNGDNRYFRLMHHHNGTLYSDHYENPSNISISSDRRLKNVGEEYTAGLAELKKLNFFHFTFKQDEEKTPHVGVIAQDLEKVFPDAVTKGEDGYLRIRWEDMFYAVINAVKELDNKIAEIVQNITEINSTIEKQNKTIEEQQKTIDELIKRIEKLEKQK